MAKDAANVFAFPDFDQSSKWLNLTKAGDDQFFHVDVEEPGQVKDGPLKVQSPHAPTDGFFKVPSSLGLSVLNGLSDGEDADTAFLPAPLHDVQLEDLDIFDEAWLQRDAPPTPTAGFRTWDAFAAPDIPQLIPLFITEANPGVYDAAIDSEDDPLGIDNVDHYVVRSNTYLAALLGLALGRGSVFFSWDVAKACFVADLDRMRVSGYSAQVLEGLQTRCSECGTTTRFLSAYVQCTYRTHPSAARVALAKAVDVILLSIQRQLGDHGRKTRSLLQLQALVQPVHSITTHTKRLVMKASKCRNDEQVASLVFEEVLALENGDVLQRDIMREILRRVSEPWLDFAAKWIGLKAEEGVLLTKDGPGKSFVKIENIAIIDDFGFESEERDYVLDEGRLPDFVSSEIALVMFEAGRNLRLLRTHHPENPLCHMNIMSSAEPPPLQWHFDWNRIQQFQDQVGAYERCLRRSIQDRRTTGAKSPIASIHLGVGAVSDDPRLEFFGQEASQLEARLLASIKILNQPPAMDSQGDSLSQLFQNRLFQAQPDPHEIEDSFSLHWSLIPLHTFGPLVRAQARLINREYMKLLFSVHNLREHLRVQKEFQLLGSGIFCSRLSHALFDPELDTAERQAGVALNGGVMGLRLTGRENWPPASSELRLALMGVLNESYQHAPASRSDSDRRLPGDLSFAVRDLSPEEIDKCLDPTSLEALDFLRLAYKTPTPLSPVFPPVLLLKYDTIFRLLLRVLRMLYVAGQLFRDTVRWTRPGLAVENTCLRFRYEAHHFITSIATYFFDTSIKSQWKRFESWLDGVESDLEKVDVDPKADRVLSLDEVREEHERTLDEMMQTLLLRKRQQPVLRLLEEIFNSILQFAKLLRPEGPAAAAGDRSRDTPPPLLEEQYRLFKKKVDVFITVCRGLSEKEGVPAGNSARRDLMTMTDVTGKRREDRKEESPINKLLMKLDMSGYYTRSRK